MERTDQRLITLYQEAYKYLEDIVGKKVIEDQLNYYHNYKPTSMTDVFHRMIETLKNKQGYVNFIANISDMKDILFEYDSQAVVAAYGKDWRMLFDKFKERFGKKYRMDPDNKRGAWVTYSKGVLSCAKFAAGFESLNDFDKFVKSFFYNEYTVAALPMLLDREIFGFGFPLACDFLKELGYTKYGKPDVHLKDLFIALNIVDDDSDYETFKKIVKIGILVNQEPVIVDKVFWLIGSGNFNLANIKIPRQKEKFIEYFKRKYPNKK